MMRNTGWGQATTAKVARIWRREGLEEPHKSSPLEAGCGSPMVAVCACEQRTLITSGVMTLS